jgi:hypothetical protein
MSNEYLRRFGRSINRNPVYSGLILVAVLVAASFYEQIGWALAALSSGALLGFLFGVPRVEQEPTLVSETESTVTSSVTYRQSVNTNLEKISDWLTTIIVGVGLVSLNEIPPRFQSLVVFLAGDRFVPGHVGVILVSFAVAGFLGSYILTRLVLAKAFSEADRAANLFDAKAETLPEAAEEAEPEFEVTAEAYPISAREVVLDAWKRLYEVARDAIERKSAEGSRTPQRAYNIISKLRELNLIDDEQLTTFRKLNEMIVLANASSSGISNTAALSFAANANSLIQHLQGEG